MVFKASMAIAVAIFIGAWFYSGTIKSHYNSAEEADPQAIRDRIRPLSTVIVEGQELPAAPAATAGSASVTATVADTAASSASNTVTATVDNSTTNPGANAGNATVANTVVAQVDPAATTAAATNAAASKVGEDTYKMACFACHMTGVAGAPKTGDVEAWAPRIAKGMDVMNQNAINGFQGSTGMMPPKGGRVDLSDEVIIAAVAYMVEQSSGK